MGGRAAVGLPWIALEGVPVRVETRSPVGVLGGALPSPYTRAMRVDRSLDSTLLRAFFSVCFTYSSTPNAKEPLRCIDGERCG